MILLSEIRKLREAGYTVEATHLGFTTYLHGVMVGNMGSLPAGHLSNKQAKQAQNCNELRGWYAAKVYHDKPAATAIKPEFSPDDSTVVDPNISEALSSTAESTLLVKYLAGRCANGAERGKGTRWHAVRAGNWSALCGAKPGQRSAGWAPFDYNETDIAKVTCPRCLKRLPDVADPNISEALSSTVADSTAGLPLLSGEIVWPKGAKARGRLKKALAKQYTYPAGVQSLGDWLETNKATLLHKSLYVRLYGRREVNLEKPRLARPKHEYSVVFQCGGEERAYDIPKIVYDALDLPEELYEQSA